MKRIVFVSALVVALGVIVALSACSGGYGSQTPSGGTTTGGNTVILKDFAFAPATLEVAVGDTVTWTNEDTVLHTVTGDGGIDSGDMASGESYAMSFDTAGEYAYSCSIHPAMTGMVIVK
jgi:plastocyanin